jgi:hypothetical protein
MLVTVPLGMTPTSFDKRLVGPDLCDLKAGPSLSPGAWVNLRIVRKPGTTPTPDAAGRYLHFLIKFARPPSRMLGKRRETIQGYAPSVGDQPTPQESGDPIWVEFDPPKRRVWVGSQSQLFLMGGVGGDEYLVTAAGDVPRDESNPANIVGTTSNPEPPFDFELTSFFFSEDTAFSSIPEPPEWHEYFYLVQGSGQVVVPGGPIPITAYGRENSIPTTAPGIQVATAIARTGGSI